MNRKQGTSLTNIQTLEEYANAYVTKRPTRMRTSHPTLYQQLQERTFFLKKGGIRQRLWHVLHNQYHVSLCKKCNEFTKWDSTTKQYREFCSIRCANMFICSPSTKWNSKDTAVISSLSNQQLRVLPKNNPLLYSNLREKTKFLPISASIMQRVFHIKNNTTQIPKCKTCEVRKVKWDGALGNNTYRTFCSSFCSSTHPDVRNKYTNTSTKRYGTTHKAKEGKDSSLESLTNRYWCIEQHYVLQRTLTDIAHELQLNVTTISNYFHQHQLQIKRFSHSDGEREISNWLKNIGERIIVNDRKILKNYELDIVLPEYNLAIEYCGMYWHSDLHKNKNYHLNKLRLCKKQNIRLITIYDSEWMHKQNIIKSMIVNSIGKTPYKLNARDCTVRIVPSSEQREFLNATHIQGHARTTIAFGLYTNGKLVALMSVIKRKSNYYELNRFTTLLHTTVRGGFSKLLKALVQHLPVESSLISFADLRWSQGNVYYKNKFSVVYILKPAYAYGWYEGGIGYIKHRSTFRKEFLQKKLNYYDSTLTEFENCDNHHLLRIWDCGKIKFKYEPAHDN